MKKVLFVLLCVCLGSAVSSANIVSWNLNHWSDSPTDGSATAGVGPYAAAYWNDTWTDGLPNPASDLRDSTGGTTSVDISWSSFNTWSIVGSHLGADTDGSLNREMLNGYLNSGPAGWGPWTTESSVTLSQIVAEDTSYDIVVYFSSDVAGREGYVTDGLMTYYFNTLGPASINDASGNAVFVQAADTTDAGYLVAANYAVFSGLTGSSQTITIQMRDEDEWGGIAGVQVVGVVPEPATMALLGLGALLLRKRK